jgi:hypothetical protein
LASGFNQVWHVRSAFPAIHLGAISHHRITHLDGFATLRSSCSDFDDVISKNG